MMGSEVYTLLVPQYICLCAGVVGGKNKAMDVDKNRFEKGGRRKELKKFKNRVKGAEKKNTEKRS